METRLQQLLFPARNGNCYVDCMTISPSTPFRTAAWTVAYPRRRGATEHDVASQVHLARQLAILLQCRAIDPYRPDRQRQHNCYYVPDRTLMGLARARALGISGAGQLYGGVVPHHFVATKSISHALWSAASTAPPGWSYALGAQLYPHVLHGFSAFAREDGLRAGRLLLGDGPLCIKPVHATAGRGQRVVNDIQELAEALTPEAWQGDLRGAVVLEENLFELQTFSVGWCHAGQHALAYVGTQELTRDNHNQEVYGGSVLHCRRGGRESLDALAQDDTQRAAINAARAYDQAVSTAFPAMLASRRNYDIAIGRNVHGQRRVGVLEQSWRAGGASAAEVAALLYLAIHTADDSICAYTRERYGLEAGLPPDGDLVYHGCDSQLGPMTKAAGILTGASLDAY